MTDERSNTESSREKIPLIQSLTIALIFLVSGASALIYEVVWTRQLTTLFGATIYAVATVLTAFMGGLALGSWLIGRRADRIRHPLAFFGWLEVTIAASAFAFPFVLDLVTPVIGKFYATGGEGTFYLFSLIRFLIAFVLLMIPTTLMGATLPVMAKAVAYEEGSIGKVVGGLYAINTLGAVCGVFFSGFFLLEHLGVWKSTLVAVAGDASAGLLALFLASAFGIGDATSEQRANEQLAAKSEEGLLSAKGVRFVLIAYFFTGFVALCYQIAWTRSLIFGFETLKATTYSFSGMLTVFLLGLAIGSFLMRQVVDRLKDPLLVFAGLQLLLGLWGALTPFFIQFPLPSFLVAQELNLEVSGDLNYAAAVWNIIVRTSLVIGFPTIIMGMLFPVVIRLVTPSLASISRSVADVYAVNTFGAIAGAFLGGFVLVPALGISWTIMILAGVTFIIAIGAFMLHPQSAPSRKPVLVASLGGAALLLLFMLGSRASNGTFHPLTIGESMVYYDEGPLATVSVIEDSKGWRTIYVDAIGVAGTDPVLQTDQKSLAHVPMVLLGGEAESVLTVGFGSGGASFSYTLYPEIEKIHAIEITTTMPDAAYSLTDANHGIVYEDHVIEEFQKVLGPDDVIPGVDGAAPSAHPISSYVHEPKPGMLTFDPRYRIIVDDARAYLRFTEETYDVIATDCTDLRYKSNANLYDLEYFELCKKRISDRGLVVVWMPLAGLSDEAFRIVARTFQEVFPDMNVWYFANQPTHYCLFIGQKDGVKINYTDVLKALEIEAIQADMDEIGLRDPVKLVSSFVSDDRGLNGYVGEGPLNTEDFPIIEFLSPKFGYDATPVAINMGNVFDVQVPVWDLIVDKKKPETAAVREKLDAYQRANAVAFEGHVHYRLYEFEDATRKYLQAKEIAPDDTSLDGLLDLEELLLLMHAELERSTTVQDGQSLNAQWIAHQLGRSYLLQGRVREAVTEVMPFVRRLPEPHTINSDSLMQNGRALNDLLADLYREVGNLNKAAEFEERAKLYGQNDTGETALLRK